MSSRVMVASGTGTAPPTSDRRMTLRPSGPTRSTSRSSGKECVRFLSVTVTRKTVPVRPETRMVEGYGMPRPGPVSSASAMKIASGDSKPIAGTIAEVICAATLLGGNMSNSTAPADATLRCSPGASRRAATVTTALVPTSSEPSAHSTCPATNAHAPWLDWTDTNSALVGIWFVSMTPVATEGPRLLTTRV